MKKSVFLTISSFVLYFLQSLVRGILVGTFNTNESVAEICSIFLILAIVFWVIRKKETLSYYGICKWEETSFYKTNFLLFLVPFVNLPYLFSGAKINIVFTVTSSIFIGIMEELVFRSFLCRSIEQVSDKNKAIIISSLIFGCFHLINIGSYPFIYVILQVLYAFSMGIVFSVVFYQSNSIIPCVIVHIVIDFFGEFEIEPIFIVEIFGTILCGLCAIYFYFKNNSIKKQENCGGSK